MHQASTGTAQRDAAYEEDGEHNVGEQGGEVDHLAGTLDALHNDEEYDGPGQQQAQHNPPLEAAGLIHRWGSVQCGAIPEVRCLRRLGALLQLKATTVGRATGPGQGILRGKSTVNRVYQGDIRLSTHPKTVEEIEEHPRDNHVVVERHKQRDNARRDADAAQPRMYGIPHTQCTQPHTLPHAELDEEQRYALQYQHYHEGYQKCTCRWHNKEHRYR